MSGPREVDRWKDLHTLQKSEGETRRMRGLVTVGSIDSDQEIIDQDSAFSKMLEWVELGGNPITFNHDPGGSLGKCIECVPMTRTERGFQPRTGTGPLDAVQAVTEFGKDWGFGTMLHGRVEVNDVWAQLEFGAQNKFSIGFRGYEAGQDDETGVPIIKVSRIKEYAVAPVPAQREAAGVVEAMLKSLGIQRERCTSCSSHLRSGLERAQKLDREQWRYILDHAKEHAQDTPGLDLEQDWTVVAEALRGVGKRLGGADASGD